MSSSRCGARSSSASSPRTLRNCFQEDIDHDRTRFQKVRETQSFRAQGPVDGHRVVGRAAPDAQRRARQSQFPGHAAALGVSQPRRLLLARGRAVLFVSRQRLRRTAGLRRHRAALRGLCRPPSRGRWRALPAGGDILHQGPARSRPRRVPVRNGQRLSGLQLSDAAAHADAHRGNR